MQLLFLFLGGGLGAVVRYLISAYMNSLAGSFPLGTLTVNVVGSFLIGFILVLLNKLYPSSLLLAPLVVTGFLGGFTTFSAFSWETLSLFEKGDLLMALANIGANLIFCLLAVFAGYLLAKQF